MNANHALYERIEALIHKVIQDRLHSCRGFNRQEWHDWPGTKSLSLPAANSIFMLLGKEGLLLNPDELKPGAIQELSFSGPTREDRAYQVLCALVSSPQDGSPEAFVKSSWDYVDLMEKRSAE